MSKKGVSCSPFPVPRSNLLPTSLYKWQIISWLPIPNYNFHSSPQDRWWRIFLPEVLRQTADSSSRVFAVREKKEERGYMHAHGTRIRKQDSNNWTIVSLQFQSKEFSIFYVELSLIASFYWCIFRTQVKSDMYTFLYNRNMRDTFA